LLDKRINRLNNQRSLSKKGYQYANAVAKATFNSMKAEFVKGEKSCQLKHNNKPLQLTHITTLTTSSMHCYVTIP
jgi:transposase InsO family protein